MAISFRVKGNYSKTKRFLEHTKEVVGAGDFNKYGQMGVEALQKATPVDTGNTAQSWRYRIRRERTATTIEWYNTNVVNGVSVAILLQYGHATKNGCFVQGRDYINPAIKPVFDKIAEDAWGEVTRL